MNICDVSTSNLIRSLDSYHATRTNGLKAYIIHNGNELEVKTLTLWDRINLFVQKLFGNTTPDTLYGQIKAGSDKIGSVVSEIGFRNFDKYSLYDKKSNIVGVLKNFIINRLAKRSFNDINRAYIVAIYLGIRNNPHELKKANLLTWELQKAKNEELFVKQQNSLKKSLGKENLHELCQKMNEEYFGGNQVFKEKLILPS